MKNDKIKYLIINELIKLMKDINIKEKEIPENKCSKEVANIVEEIFNFDEQQKGKNLLQTKQRI